MTRAIQPKDIRVLVVEDQEAMRAVIVTVLQNLRIGRIQEADNGREALEHLQRLFAQRGPFDPRPVHLIIADWKMPKLSGLDLLKTIRANETFREIPFLMVTAQSDEASVIQARRSGVSDYIVKPFHAATLEEKIKKIFSLP